MQHILLSISLVLFSWSSGTLLAADERLVAHWKLAGDAQDTSGNGMHGTLHGVRFVEQTVGGHPRMVALFDGRDDWIEISDCQNLKWGTDEFTMSAWVNTDSSYGDALGDILCKYDTASRTGVVWNIKQNVGGTTSAANVRQVQFGIDAGTQPTWIDYGRPGEAVLIYSLAVFDGALFAGTCEAGKESAGRVFRCDGQQQWFDCGAVDRCNAVSALAEYDGQLYAAVSKYRLRGSSLDESENPHLGGKVYRYEGRQQWTHVGSLPGVEAISGLAVFRGKLYATSTYAPAGLFRYDGGETWTDCGSPAGKRVEALCIYNGQLFAGAYDEGAVYRYDGNQWHHCGVLGENTQTYGFAVYRGQLFVGTWRTGRVYRYRADHDWIDMGQLGEELEVMGMAVYNGQLYAGTLPLAEVYRMDGPDHWHKVGRVDHTANVKYRRAWTMAVAKGRLFVGTLPSGHVWSMEAGKSVTHDRQIPSGWVHLTAVKGAERLCLYVNGQLAAESSPFEATRYDVNNSKTLKIGFGPHDYFNGCLSDVRIFGRALSPSEIARLTAANSLSE